MIRYRLACACGHEFDAWFRSGSAYDEIAARHALQCPACGAASVGKAMMAPRIVASAWAGAGKGTAAAGNEGPDPEPPTTLATATDELVAAARRLRQAVVDKADYVGPRFADEARRIDAGDAPDRQIYGEATTSEAKALIDDGIAVLPLPRLPEEHH